jgi:hypothetical protein
MSMRALAKICLAIALMLAADFSAAAAEGQQRYSVRRRIGRVLRPLAPAIAPLSFFRFNEREPFDYYGNRRIVPKSRGRITPNDIVGTLKKRGFHDIEVRRHRGTAYIVEATGALGERVRLVINGSTGGIDGVRVIGSKPAAKH